MPAGKFDARLDTVPLSPGVYLMKDSSGCVIYVGKAKKLRNRLKSYFGGGVISSPKVRAMVSHVADFEYTVVGSEPEALLLENNLIKRYQPKYNILRLHKLLSSEFSILIYGEAEAVSAPYHHYYQ